MQIFAEEHDKTHGGKRRGAGRKKRDSVQITVRISREANDRLRNNLCAIGLSPGMVIEELILRHDLPD